MHPEAATLTTPVLGVSDADPLWYKDAVIYQIHVRAFYDSDGDGVGDFPGLTQKLDYIQDLGVTAIWLLPFFPSPLRDDGYDIADYTNVNPTYGTLRDFKTFLREAHRRDLRVITELVLNHTSDQHEWFQRSRNAKPGSKWRDFYVWSDTPDQYREARVIFQDFEGSNWTWDPVAGAYFWHRFYHHQPDLNFDNPEVHKAMLDVIDFWLKMGVDGVRLDAVPYLYEREGTNCENLPETHQFLKKLRQHLDERYPDKMLLAEANQWPEDASAYFGDGDECHMNFHFPLMPRLFMAAEREDRFPVIDILDQTPTLPDGCQWAIFLRNHDELTLEMVTDEERDYMYRSYAADPQARINLGIRRRLAPLLRNNRRKIELMNGLLFSLPGTPIVYYGDEIGMGDNIYLGDRNGVRTPMQWNADRNAGFSKANPQKLFLPTIIDPEYHFALRNVEVEQISPHSLLWWMRRIINMRKQFQAFGRGSFEMLTPDNPKVLAYLREYDGERLLVVANLSRYSQCAELDLSRFRGQTPTELFGQTQFPPIGELPYFLTLGPHGFYWFRLQWRDAETIELSPSELPVCRVKEGWEKVFTGRAKGTLHKALAPYLRRQRWFAGKARAIQSAEVIDVFPLQDARGNGRRKRKGSSSSSSSAGSAVSLVGSPRPHAPAPMRLLLVRVDYTEGEPDTYLVPVVLADDERAGNILGDHPAAGLLTIESDAGKRRHTLCEATWEAEFWQLLMRSVAQGININGQHGTLQPLTTQAFRKLWHAELARQTPAVHGGEQSNTSTIFGERLILKLFRRLSSGVNPDLEIGRFLTEHTSLEHVPKVAGALEYHNTDGEPMTAAIVHEFIPNEGDAWVYTLDELSRYFEQVQSVTSKGELPPEADEPPARSAKISAILDSVRNASLLELADAEPPPLAVHMIGPYLQSAELLGQRTAELHIALAQNDQTPAFAPEPFTKLYQRSLYQSMRTQARKTLSLLGKQFAQLPASLHEEARHIAEQESAILKRFREMLDRKLTARRIRCHGDYHLGQVLFTGKDFVIIDFEGEPERPVSERRIKASPLRDVAGMIRSFHYASHAILLGQSPGLIIHHDAMVMPEAWMQFWYAWVSASFLKSYLSVAERDSFLPADREELDILLRAHLLEKALYELGYELNNRPGWVRIPVEGILQLLDEKLTKES